jgi:ribonucleoside-diphosphate reductase alpha chain
MMNVTKRNGKKEPVNFNKISERLKKLINVNNEPLQVDVMLVAQKVVAGLYDGVTTRELDNLAAETAAGMVMIHPDYDRLAARIEISSLHKETSGTFSDKITRLADIRIISNNYRDYVSRNRRTLDDIVDYARDYSFDFFGIRTLKRSYLLKDDAKNIVERPQDMWLRVASFIHGEDWDRVKETYRLLSHKYFTHATPTLFNAGTVRPQLSSCFLLDIADDSIEGIYKTLSDCAKISQSAGGIGLAIHKIRSTGSYISGTNGVSNGIVPMLRVFDTTARYVDQGGGKRKGSIAVYLEPWHADIFEFLELKKNHGKEELRARDLFYAMWIPDLFMRRVEEDGEWTLFDPKRASGLIDAYGKDFDKLYSALEAEAKKSGVSNDNPGNDSYGVKEQFKTAKTIKARDLWDRIIASQIETGTPYMLYKDAANLKSNQQNVGTIKSSNLCTEILEYTSPDETAVCNLASLSLPAYVVEGKFDFDALYRVTRVVTRNLDRVIDITYYPIPEARTSNLRHRPIGIGVQGLADVFAKLKIAYDSREAKELNKRIFETIYKGSVDESIKLAEEAGPYSSYEGSPASEGRLQFDLWGYNRAELSYDWKATFDRLATYGLRNSLLVAPMPTASTAQILGNNEAFEPFTSNIYLRRTLSGEFVVVNKYLVNELREIGLWSESVRQAIIASNGSVQSILSIPGEIRNRYRTVWEMSMKDIIDMSADRGPFICQSQSLNLFITDPTPNKLTSMHFYAWKKGLKTGQYYLRTNAAVDAIKFTVDKDKANEGFNKTLEKETQQITKEIIDDRISESYCSLDNPDACEACSG